MPRIGINRWKFMADFKLTEVAKKAGITTDEALQRLREAGESVADTAASITVEQMRLIGVDPQQMIDRRKERLQQVLERRNRGTMGKEVVMNSRPKEESPAATRKISKEDLLKRKSELDKSMQKVDEERQQRADAQESVETVEITEAVDSAVINSEPLVEQPAIVDTPDLSMQATPDLSKQAMPVVEAVSTEPEPEPQAIETPAAVEPVELAKPVETAKPKEEPTKPVTDTQDKPKKPETATTAHKQGKTTSPKPTTGRADSTPTTSPTAKPARPAGPAGYVAGEKSGRPRPTGPASSQGRSTDRSGRPSERTGDRTSDRPQQGRGARPSTLPPKSEQLITDERRRADKKKEIEPTAAAKEEAAKKAKLKSDPKNARTWSKTISEGMGELDIEKEIDSATPVSEEVVTTPTRPAQRYDRRTKKRGMSESVVATPKPTHISIGESITVADLAGLVAVRATELVKKLFSMGIMATVNQSIDAETATLLAIEYDVEVTKTVITEEDLLPVFIDAPEDLERRPPVVTVMGHVDHGKTSLLDAIRSTSVAEKEAGGITQHIGAYEVELQGRRITFLDTPGHEAFTSLRARGAQATDIVILVVAANDGVMPQTKEAIDHAKAAGVKIVVAINKIDVENAKPDHVRQQLSNHGIISEEWGGDVQFQEISAKKRIGIEDLLERVLLEADVLELTGNSKRPAEGIVIESQLDKQKGAVATVLVRNGVLHRGDTFLIGSQVGKVRSMHNYRGTVVRDALISMPVEVMGFSHVPAAGDKLVVIEDMHIAQSIADIRARHEQEMRHSSNGAISLTDFFDRVKQGEVKELNIIIKADAQGSIEALKGSLLKLSNAEVKVNVVHDATGGITESDVVLAMASKAIIIGFNVRPDNNAKNLADRENISIELYSIIYKAIEDVRLALEGMLTPETVERTIGKVEVRQVFSVPKLGKIAGCYVQEGKVIRSANVRVIRDNVVVYDGKLGSLKRFTDDAKEVLQGYECGMSIDKYQDIKEGDIFEIYELIEEKRTLEDVAKGE
jgi:translation initiation factor IF-2